jgi:hypothetical protein
MLVLGIDPGLNGAIVLLDDAGGLQNFLMPLTVEGKNKSLDFEALQKNFQGIPASGCHVFLERAVAFGMGLTGAFSYGRGFGFIEIAIKLAGLPVTQVSPKEWTKEMHQGISADLKPKVKSQIAVERLFPQFVSAIPRAKGKMHEGIVDALLIAGYGLRKLGQK